MSPPASRSQSGAGVRRDLANIGRVITAIYRAPHHAFAAELVPKLIADKIAERDPSLVVRVNKTGTEIDTDDPYAAFQVPDDLMW